nr:MAG TPA: hypothetical protein [Caudoviricetes sp.]
MILGLKYMLFNFFRVVRFAHYICAERRCV